LELYGRIVKNSKTVREASIEKSREGAPYRDILEECLLGLCKELEIPVPIWLKKNTSELVNFQKTFFYRDQFVENIKFDAFEISFK
jgi:hypothetical protein